VQTVDEVLAYALAGTLTPIEWDENAEVTPPPSDDSDGDNDSTGQRH